MDHEENATLTNQTFGDDVLKSLDETYLAPHDIITIVISFISIFAYVFIIYIILGYKKMHTIPNIILVNWAFADLFLLINNPITYGIFAIFGSYLVPTMLRCFLMNAGFSLQLAIEIFVFVLALDWCFAAYVPKTSEHFRRSYKFMLVLIWIFIFIIMSIFTGRCIAAFELYDTQNWISLVSYCALLLFIFGLQTSRCVKKCRGTLTEYPTLMLTLATVYIFCSFLAYIELFTFVGLHLPKFVILIGTGMLFSNGVVNFIVLYCCNKDFQKCFLTILRRSNVSDDGVDVVFRNPISRPVS